jgi:hypothetical protein
MRAAVGLAGLSMALGCGAVQPSQTTSAPANSCPEHPCSAYAGAVPTCSEGTCLVSPMFQNDVLFVSMRSESPFAPDRTIAVPLPAPAMQCTTGVTCTLLPDVAQVLGAYSVSAQTQNVILHYALNTPNAKTTLPVHVSYRPLWPPSSLMAGYDAIAAGLPFDSVEVDSTTNSDLLDSDFSGPAGGPSQKFATYLQPGYYLRTVRPQAPLDAVLPPDVRVVNVPPPGPVVSFEDDGMRVDATSAETGIDHPVTPTFSLTFVGSGSFDGWTALLRDQTTKQVLSNVVALGGSVVGNLVLPTNHYPSDNDALTNAELFLEPTSGQPLPAAVFATLPAVVSQGGTLAASVQYPGPVPLPPPIEVAGTVSAPDGAPVEADLLFEATGIAEASGRRPQGTMCSLNTANLEYATRASARIDATGSSTWAVQLPVGQYRVSIRPLDSIPSPPAAPVPVPVFAVTLVSPFVVGPIEEACAPASDTALKVSATQAVAGVAVVADGRFLSGAVVDAIPLKCADGSASAACLPRPREAGTGDDGSFRLLLDPGGSYLLRARPADGTRLPWTVLQKPLLVAPGSTPTPRITVPAPFSAGLQLEDPSANYIIDSIVRIFELHPSGRWLEVGHAVTDATGHYEMYLAPPAQ